MKKILVLALALVLCMSLSLTAFAGEYTVGDNGIAVYDNAIGYVFDIEDINGTITGEDATICTSVDGLATCGVWSTWLIAEKVNKNIYVAVTDGTAMPGESPAIELDDDQIIIVVHSSTSKPEEAAKEGWDNWEDKVAFLAVVAGDYLVFDGIDIEAGTCNNGRILCTTKDDVLAGTIKWPDGTETKVEDDTEESAPATGESEPETDESGEPETDESGEPETESNANGTESKSDDTVGETESESEIIDDSEIVSSDIEIDGEGGLGVWLWVIIGAAAVVVVIVIALIAKKK